LRRSRPTCSHKIEFSFLNGNLMDAAVEEHQIQRDDNPTMEIENVDPILAAGPRRRSGHHAVVAVSVKRVAMTIAGEQHEVST
jgi:hypothetical protein